MDLNSMDFSFIFLSRFMGVFLCFSLLRHMQTLMYMYMSTHTHALDDQRFSWASCLLAQWDRPPLLAQGDRPFFLFVRQRPVNETWRVIGGNHFCVCVFGVIFVFGGFGGFCGCGGFGGFCGFSGFGGFGFGCGFWLLLLSIYLSTYLSFYPSIFLPF